MQLPAPPSTSFPVSLFPSQYQDAFMKCAFFLFIISYFIDFDSKEMYTRSLRYSFIFSCIFLSISSPSPLLFQFFCFLDFSSISYGFHFYFLAFHQVYQRRGLYIYASSSSSCPKPQPPAPPFCRFTRE